MYPNPFYRNMPYRMPMYPPQMPIRPPGFSGIPGGPGLPRPPIPPVSPAASPSRIEQFLQSTGQLMKTAQTYAPYVQQAMPMFKNLPALIKLYKGFQNVPDAKKADSSSPSKLDAFFESSQKPKRSVDYTTKPSLPKIYQP